MPGSKHQGNIITGLPREVGRDLPEECIITTLATSALAKETVNPVLTGVVSSSSKVPATKPIIELLEIVESSSRRLDRITTLIEIGRASCRERVESTRER